MKKLYRIENPTTGKGLWYLTKGEYTGFIKNLTAPQSGDFPMEYNEEFKADGRDWFSACETLDIMRSWFSPQDVEELVSVGYGLYEFTVPDYRIANGHAIFLKESAVMVPGDLKLILPS